MKSTFGKSAVAGAVSIAMAATMALGGAAALCATSALAPSDTGLVATAQAKTYKVKTYSNKYFKLKKSSRWKTMRVTKTGKKQWRVDVEDGKVKYDNGGMCTITLSKSKNLSSEYSYRVTNGKAKGYYVYLGPMAGGASIAYDSDYPSTTCKLSKNKNKGVVMTLK